jgi:4-phospho-D-threonate 3-dehydrogenase / 4-phospho-D-erythronate 3-dehydrogenase
MNPADDNRPLLALTMGDITGIGPEIIIKALSDEGIYDFCRPLVVGDLPALAKAREICRADLTLHETAAPGGGRFRPGTVDILVMSRLDQSSLFYGQPTPASGAAMVEYILQAVDLTLSGQAGAVVTAPISKAAMHLGGYHYPGHTELLAERCQAPEFAMMLAGGAFRVVLATIHCPLREVPGRLNQADLVRLLSLTNRSLISDFGLHRPCLGVAALNPHAGEGGLFGTEEAQIIQPAIAAVREQQIDVVGPLPADTIFVRHQRGEFDAVVVMYHDQGLIPLKLLHFGDAVNVTLGLPIIRTSVDHGTAYDLAGTGQADPGSLKAALHLATQMAHARAGRA